MLKGETQGENLTSRERKRERERERERNVKNSWSNSKQRKRGSKGRRMKGICTKRIWSQFSKTSSKTARERERERRLPKWLEGKKVTCRIGEEVQQQHWLGWLCGNDVGD